MEGAAAGPPHTAAVGAGAPLQTANTPGAPQQPKSTPPRKEHSERPVLRQAEQASPEVKRLHPWGVCELRGAAALPTLANTPLTTTL